MQLDYASLLRGGQSLVPDIRQQMMQDEAFDMQRQQFDMQRQAIEERRKAAQVAQERQAAFQPAVERALLDHDPMAFARLMVQFPEYAEQAKPVWDMMDEQRQKAELTQAGTLASRLLADDLPGAIGLLSQRVEADREAGNPDPMDEAILAGLKSENPAEQRAARNMIIGQVSIMPGGKDYLGEIMPDDPIAAEQEYDFNVRTYGQEYADRVKKAGDVKLITPLPGAQVYNAADFIDGGTPPQPQGGGDPASTGGGYALPVEGASFDQAAQQYGAARGGGRTHNGIDFSGRLGSPVRPVQPGTVIDIGSDARSGNYVKVKHGNGSVSSYAHLGDISVQRGQQIDASTSLGTLGLTGNASAGEGRGVLHFVMRDASGKVIDPAPLFGGPVRVRSKQEYDRLASGTEYIAPDGSPRRKP